MSLNVLTQNIHYNTIQNKQCNGLRSLRNIYKAEWLYTVAVNRRRITEDRTNKQKHKKHKRAQHRVDHPRRHLGDGFMSSLCH